MKDQRQFLILLYYELGMTYSDITFTLANRHGIILSVRHLKRILKTIGIGRRNYSKLEEVIIFIVNQLQGSGMMHGYRMMHTKCREFGFNVAKEHVRIILRELDPAGVDRRQARRLVRRRYESDGPNAVWHLDGYDKLKPYGLCVSGCVDGFSRKVIWLNVYCTNSDPRIIGGYYLEAVQKFGGCPKRVRGDFGTENVSVRDLQIFLRRHDEDTTTAYIEGSSTLNQRIESWWGILRRQCVDFWIELFRELHLADNFSGDFLDRNLVQFCFTAAIQNELDTFAAVWNSHTVRSNRHSSLPSGRPNVLHAAPVLWGYGDKLFSVDESDVEACMSQVLLRSSKPCDKDIYDIAVEVMKRDGLEFVENKMLLQALYLHLRREIKIVL